MNEYWKYIEELSESFDSILVSSLEGKKIFITGACGLIGSCLSEAFLALNRNSQTKCQIYLGARHADRLSKRFSEFVGEFTPVEYDAMKADLPKVDFDFIFHCASNAHPKAYASQPVETALTNTLGTNNLLGMLRASSGGRLVYISSSEVYGQRKSAKPYVEEDSYPVDSLNPRSCYPASKRMAENLCAAYLAEYGVDSVIVRPGHIYGPTMSTSDSRAHAQFARNAAAGDNIAMKSDGRQFRSYCYVVDCVTAIVSVALNGRSGEAYNISNPDSDCTIAELAEAFAKAGGTKLVRSEASSDEKRGYNMMDNSALDSSKLRALGWSGRYSLEEGTRRTVELLRAGCFSGGVLAN